MRQRTALVEALAARFLASGDGLADVMVERIRAEVPELGEFDGPELWAAMRGSCLSVLQQGLTDIATGRDDPAAVPPPARKRG